MDGGDGKGKGKGKDKMRAAKAMLDDWFGLGDGWGMGGGMADMWGGAGDSYGWGPWADGGGKGKGGPYGKGGGKGGGKPRKKKEEEYEEKPRGPTPEIIWLKVAEDSALCQLGFPTEGPSICYDKSYDIFSEADHILWDFMPEDMDMKQVVEFNFDSDCETFPEIYAAWKAAGQDDNLPTVATCPSAGKWAVGFGGKAFGMRAAKLAIALQLAFDAEPTVLATAVQNHPSFGKFLKANGAELVAA